MPSAPLAASLLTSLAATLTALLAVVSTAVALPAWVPFDSPAGLVVFKGRINGQFEVRLLLDTGDPTGLTLREEAARRIGLTLGPEVIRRAIGPVGSESHTLHRSRVETLEFGGIEIRDQAIWIVPGAPRFAEALGTEVDGYLGVEALRGLVVTLDYPARRVRFERPGDPATGDGATGTAAAAGPSEDGLSYPLRILENRLLVEASLGGGPPRAMILDTACAVTMASTADLLLTRPAPARNARIADGAGRIAALQARTIPSFGVAGRVFVDLPVGLYDFSAPPPGLFPDHTPPISGVVGSDVLSRQVVVLDLASRRLMLGPPQR